MPALLTHYCFARMAIEPRFEEYRDVIDLATQGPDPFFFYGQVKKRPGKQEISSYGGLIHHIDISETYLKMMEYAKESPHKDMLVAYLAGILMHYSVDSVCHPYIFFSSGFDEEGHLTGYYSWSHKALEALIDVVLSKKRGYFKAKPGKTMKLDSEKLNEISKMWGYAGPDYIQDDSFVLATQDYIRAFDLIQSHGGWKRPIWRIMGKYSAMYGLSYPARWKRLAKCDPLNEEHREWQDPTTGLVHRESFEELLEIAKKKYHVALGMLDSFLEGKDISAEFKAWVNNIDHDGGIIGEKMTHFSLCWERLH